MARDWVWIPPSLAVAIHHEMIAAHGGGDGVRDIGLLESALARPVNLSVYDTPDAAALAASYAYGIARNHPFIDGNKRTAAVVGETFLVENGYELRVDDADLVVTFFALAAGEIKEEALAAWFRARIVASGTNLPPAG